MYKKVTNTDNSHKNQQGFTAVEALLIILVLAVIGFGGYYIWHTQHKAKTTAATITTSSSTKPATTTPTTKTITNPVSYFTLSQWGVRAPYSGSLTLQYQPDTSNSSQMFVSSTQLNAGGPSICTTADGGAGYIGRYLPTDDIPTQGPPAETAQSFVSQDFAASNSVPPAYSKVGNYYYIYFDASNDCANTTLQTQTTQAFTDIVDHLATY